MQGPPFPPPTGEYSHHKANCHCGATGFTFSISPPLDKYPVVECNCSICQRNGYLLVYPIKEDLKLRDGAEEAMGSYCFANNNVKHYFCKQCGSSVFFEVLSPPKDAAAEAEGRREKLPVIMGVNLRMVTGLELSKLIIKKVNGETRGQKYAVM
ncbi:glutathione-dependent formaldehyde-activating enzyme [Diaporthe helianthi]|uniref:Glutathione-dependent formaldehyde-activating enzyme n=1 Tax=Diaporthe helianthi TaxID=158607 RepID=A0A2P5HPE3_DIAHE|nr:glutathione-dependent formaldehyde-activating enzyme [Diaporthe helianthi]